MSFPRTSGILLHPTSLPGRFGIGDLGPEAYRFIDFLAASHQKLWQILPLGAPGFGNSPYLAYSAMAGNPMLISPDRLVEQGLLDATDLENLPVLPQDQAAFEEAAALKWPLFRKAFDRFQRQASAEQQAAFTEFCQQKAPWLEDYALFMAIKQAHNGAGWTAWEPGLAKRDPAVLSQWQERLQDDVQFQKYLQYEFVSQWLALRRYANDREIQIIGDIPIYVAHDSVDVWANPENFCLNPQTGYAALMAGVPPDYFSATGQLWGNPVYNWDYLQQHDFAWWIQRFECLLEYVDVIRIDHFRGLQAYWVVPEGESTAMNGWWVEAPGYAFFNKIRDHFGKLPIIAEDLGIITPEVDALRDAFDFPGMKILQFAFDSGNGNPYLPCNFGHANCVVYTGTHDNDTTVGWFSERSLQQQWQVGQYLGHRSFHGIHWDLITMALGSVANQAITPLQDVLGLGTEARMNFPGQAAANWGWRYRSEHLTDPLGDRLGRLTQAFGRA